jgi:hypothetical protein
MEFFVFGKGLPALMRAQQAQTKAARVLVGVRSPKLSQSGIGRRNRLPSFAKFLFTICTSVPSVTAVATMR